MRKALVILGLMAPWLFLSAGEVAAVGTGSVECHSQNYQRAECAVPFRRAVLLEQKSRADCVEGRTWGLRRGRLWVSDGCAGVFGDADAPIAGPGHGSVHGSEVIECRSENFAHRQCGGTGRSAVLLQQLSRADCIEGRTWGFERRGGLWVNGGCAGRFRIESGRPGAGRPPEPPAMSDPEFLDCSSHSGGRARDCRFPVSVRQVGLFEQRSSVPCTLNHNWEWNSSRVRVWGGCAAQFRYWPR